MIIDYAVQTLTHLRDWARAMETRVEIADEDWRSITYEARTTIGEHGQHIARCRCHVELPLELALRRWARTYIIEMWHPTSEGAICHHVRQVMAPCPDGPEHAVNRSAITIAGALVERDRRTICGATAATLHTDTAQRASDWQPR